eukprot:CAMPEP_0203973646 /NCGR_PEP_ID=MMETSP0359-20131031/99696_1 /ASSEMBLY_ACC=CAM_ASM_000338 /TAXON_ID=268821 /ORGANISM="Scrippsiella Hangoei, Strain SHTV-5" /LENGTH=870 /DNA_ID=CAMNT_0050911807 /DNA_START=64 /DNA_END=2678 /DNA_ORIENTATION=-
MECCRSPKEQLEPPGAECPFPFSQEDPGSGSPGNELLADCRTPEKQHKPTGDENRSSTKTSNTPSWSAGNEPSMDSDRPMRINTDGDVSPRTSSSPRFVRSASFIATSEKADEKENAQKKVQRLLNNHWTQTLFGGVITFNFLLILLDTDDRAWYPGRGIVTSPRWLRNLEYVCLAAFGTELALRIFADGMTFHRKLWNVADALMIAIGVAELILTLAGIEMGALGIIRVLRLCRLLRLIRVLRLFTGVKELRRLLRMIGGCFKTLFWSCLLLFLMMTVWAVIAVELINPTVQQIADEGGWQGCERCRRSFASVFMADITLFQTVVAGDSWGYMAIPVIEKNPPTAIIFIGALMTLVFGVLNLIVAVIVDVFAESRERDVFTRASELEEEETEQKAALGQIFRGIDADGGGTLSLDELVQGAHKEAGFQRWLRVMDIDARDLEQLFLIVDEKGNGEIEPSEFIEAMYRMRTADSRQLGYMAIPVIEKNPPTAIIFIGALMTLVFGVLNLIVAVIVGVVTESRDKDVFARASELEEEESEQKAVFGQIFKRIDTDGGLHQMERLHYTTGLDPDRWQAQAGPCAARAGQRRTPATLAVATVRGRSFGLGRRPRKHDTSPSPPALTEVVARGALYSRRARPWRRVDQGFKDQPGVRPGSGPPEQGIRHPLHPLGPEAALIRLHGNAAHPRAAVRQGYMALAFRALQQGSSAGGGPARPDADADLTTPPLGRVVCRSATSLFERLSGGWRRFRHSTHRRAPWRRASFQTSARLDDGGELGDIGGLTETTQRHSRPMDRSEWPLAMAMQCGPGSFAARLRAGRDDDSSLPAGRPARPPPRPSQCVAWPGRIDAVADGDEPDSSNSFMQVHRRLAR